MTTADIELRRTDNGKFQVYKNGKPEGYPSRFEDIQEVDFSHPVFDVPCKRLPEEEMLNFNISNLNSEFHIVTATRVNKSLNLSFFICFPPTYNLGEHVVISKMSEQAIKHGFEVEPGISEDAVCDYYITVSAEGTLGEKILEATTLLNRIRAEVEKAIISDLIKGKLMADED